MMQNVLSVKDREGFRAWLREHAARESECWIAVRRGEPKDPGVFYYLDAVEEANLNIDYLYAAWDRISGQPFIVLHAQDMAELESFLVSRGYRALGRQEGARP